MDDHNILHYQAFCIADSLDLKLYRADNPDGLISGNSSELYYQLFENKYLYILNYGTVIFMNCSAEETSRTLKSIKKFARTSWTFDHEDKLEVHISKKDELISTFDVLAINRFDHDVNKIIMLNLAQSVTLDYYTQETQQLLGVIKSYTEEMNINGKIRMSQRNTLRFIGRALKTKNSIAENLYIIDTPDKAWEDEYIDNLHKNLTRHFESSSRYRAIENTLKIIEDNLSVFISYHHHNESSRLEWIIIILIVIEVLDTFVSKLI